MPVPGVVAPRGVGGAVEGADAGLEDEVVLG